MKPKKYSDEYVGMRCNIKGLNLFYCAGGLQREFVGIKNPREFVISHVDVQKKFFCVTTRFDSNYVWHVKKDKILNLS